MKGGLREERGNKRQVDFKRSVLFWGGLPRVRLSLLSPQAATKSSSGLYSGGVSLPFLA